MPNKDNRTVLAKEQAMRHQLVYEVHQKAAEATAKIIEPAIAEKISTEKQPITKSVTQERLAQAAEPEVKPPKFIEKVHMIPTPVVVEKPQSTPPKKRPELPEIVEPISIPISRGTETPKVVPVTFVRPEKKASEWWASSSVDSLPTSELLAEEIDLAPIETESVWIDMRPQPHQAEISDEEPAPTEAILLGITETMEISDEAAEQTETFLITLPETVQDSLADYLETSDPEEAAPIQELVVWIAQAADRLHELSMTGQLEHDEAKQIQQLLVEQYTELLTHLELEIDEETIAAFIELVCSEAYTSAIDQSEEPFDDVLRERRPHHRFDIPADFSHFTKAIEEKIARFMVARSIITT